MKCVCGGEQLQSAFVFLLCNRDEAEAFQLVRHRTQLPGISKGEDALAVCLHLFVIFALFGGDISRAKVMRFPWRPRPAFCLRYLLFKQICDAF